LHPTQSETSNNLWGNWHKLSLTQSWEQLASFPGRRRNGLATSASLNCYFRCLKVGSTNQILERSHMTTVKTELRNTLNRRSHAHSTSV